MLTDEQNEIDMRDLEDDEQAGEQLNVDIEHKETSDE